MLSRDPLVTIHGRRFGITDRGHLVLDGSLALVSPLYPADRIVHYDDFLGAVVGTQYVLTKGSDTSPTSFAINSQKGGVARLESGDSATHTYAGNGAQLDFGTLNWFAANGGLHFETRIKLDVITNMALFCGFTDQFAALVNPWSLAGTTYTSTASNSFGFLFDTAATSATIRAVGVANDVDAANVDTGIAYVAATYVKLRCSVDTSGTARFSINEALVATLSLAVTPTVALTPVFALYSSATAPVNLDIDYLHLAMDR